MPYSLASAAHSELLIKKSRFLGCVENVADRAAAQQRVAQLWAQHPGAAHVCWALLAGGQSAAVDDGEPSGTAGRPMLDVLRHQGLDGVLATVVRYYGGVQLGAGGLVRAYTGAVADALKAARKIPRVRFCTVLCRTPYELEGMVRRTSLASDATLSEVRHGDQVELLVSVPESQADAFVLQLKESGQGRIRIAALPAT